MSEPTGSYGLSDLLLRVAKAGAVTYHGSTGAGRAKVPVDEATFHRCLDIVNDGVKLFVNSAPTTGWNWMNRDMSITLAPAVIGTADSGTAISLTDASLADVYDDSAFNTFTIKITDGTGEGETATVTGYTGATGVFDFSGGLSGGSTPDSTSQYRICRSTLVIDADPARYQLAQDFYGEAGREIRYAANSGVGCGMAWSSVGEIERAREVNVLTGYPSRAAYRPYGTRRWELIVDPSPVSADTIVFPYKVGFDRFSAEVGTATGGSAVTIVNSSIANQFANDHFNGWTIYVIDGTGVGSYATVTDYTGASGTFIVADWLTVGGLAGGIDPTAGSIYYVADNVQHPAGQQFDTAVLSACLAVAELEFEDLNLGYYQKFLTVDLPMAHQIDARSAPKSVGIMLPGRVPIVSRVWNNVKLKS